jgi:hypothetical protein
MISEGIIWRGLSPGEFRSLLSSPWNFWMMISQFLIYVMMRNVTTPPTTGSSPSQLIRGEMGAQAQIMGVDIKLNV